MRAIAAMSADRVIGYKGKLPWKNRRDMRFFKQMTWGQDVIVGHTTFLSMGILKNRHHTVLTHDPVPSSIIDGLTGKEMVEFVTLNKIDQSAYNKAWVIGGSSIYQKLLPMCTDLYLSLILDEYEGDSYMPEFEGYFTQQRIIKEFGDVWFVHYWNPDTLANEDYRDGFDTKLSGKFTMEKVFIPYYQDLNPHWSRGFLEAPLIDWK